MTEFQCMVSIVIIIYKKTDMSLLLYIYGIFLL